MLLLISLFYSSLGINKEQDFCGSVLASAFVDVISIVLTTIFITEIIGKQNKYIETRDLFEMVKDDHELVVKILKNHYRVSYKRLRFFVFL